MRRNRATLISLTLCGLVALATTAPAQSRGGDASEVRTLNSSIAVPYDPVSEQMGDLDATISLVRQERHAADVAKYVAAVEADRAAAAAEARRVEERRQAAATTAAAAAAPTPERSTYSGGGNGDPNDMASWDRLAQCESGGNWAINTGNGYYGGIQFSLSSWRAVGGAGYPHQASKAEQIRRGQMLYAQGGWGHWPGCTRSFGWR